MAESSNPRSLRHTPIAIIGMGALMPQAHNLAEFWSNIVSKLDCITDVPASRWRIEDYYDPDPAAPDKTYSKRGGFLPDVDFDPMEFGLPPNILEVTDVSQMLSLLVAKDALTDAGYLNGADAVRDKTGVVLGVGGGQKLITPLTARLQYPIWDEVLKSYGIDDANRAQIIERMKLAYVRWEENSFPGMLGNVVAGRIANRFDLGGMNCVVDAACAGTMAALKLAISELVEGRADMMLTGGVDTDNSIFMYMCFSKTPAFTKGTHPRPFDQASDGMMVGEGIGMIVLKRLADAERDGDRIYAVIRGIGASSDGRYKSIYAPRGEGQEKALRRAYEDAGVSPASVGLVEAHGTGTIAGDTTEVTTIVRFFNQHDEQKQHIALGSVKSQIGHTKASAGAAGLIKTALALHHKVLPPTLNVATPNPKFDLPNSSFYVNTEARPWVTPADTPRRAGISSFGFGGTNFHVVLEEHRPDHAAAYRLHHTPQAVIVQGDSVAALQANMQAAIDALRGETSAGAFVNLVTATRTTPLPASAARVGLVAVDAAEAATLLAAALDMIAKQPHADEWQHPKGIFYRRAGLDTAGRVVALFAGQGSQYVDMGRELALNFPEVRQAFAAVDALLTPTGRPTLSSVVFPRPAFTPDDKAAQDAALQRTDYAQPAIGALSAGMFRVLTAAGFRPSFTAGHSFGELTALWASGAIDDAAYARLTHARGAAMAPPADNPTFDAGTMLAVSGDVDAVERAIAAIPGVQVANHNSRTQVVVAGTKAAVAQAEAHLKTQGFKVTPLSVAAAFHTPLVGHAQQPFAQAIAGVTFRPAQIPVYSNATGQPYPADPAQMQAQLAQHILQPVRFRSEIEAIYAAGGSIFVEFGPRNVLTNLVKDILGDRPHVAIALNPSRQKDSDRQFREGVVQLQVLGVPLTAIDPYGAVTAADANAAPKKKGMTVKLNGGMYISDKTRQTYQAALNTPPSVPVLPPAPTIAPVSVPGPEMNTPAPVISAAAAAETPAAPVAALTPVALEPIAPLSPVDSVPSVSDNELDMSALHSLLDQTFAEFREHQRETLRVHDAFAQSQAEYFRIFFELTQQQQGLLAGGALPPGAADALTQTMQRFHDYQAETLRLHESYMQTQAGIAQALIALIGQQSGNAAAFTAPLTPAAPRRAPVAPPAPAVSSTNGTNGKHDAPALTPALAPVAAAPAPAPVAAAPAPAPVAAAPAPAPIAPPAPAPVMAPPAPAPAPAAASGQLAALNAAMLRIVADKTGYPAEMLELSMDMEADLGIDSIKRVEILGAMREDFPNLPQFSPEELGELRTLQQIVDYMAARAGSAVPAAAVAAAPAPVAAPAPAAAAAPAPASPAPAAAGIALDALNAAMLRIVADKTGYPAEMLELSMDMEADLGIDSIKRVEILGAMREDFPNLPQFSPEELGELRTLQQIVDYMGEASRRQASPFDQADRAVTVAPTGAVRESATSTNIAPLVFDAQGITQAAVALRRLTAPDRLTIAPNGAACLLTDDGTPLTGQLAAALSERGWRVIVLGLPLTPPSAVNGTSQRVTAADLTEAGLGAAVSAAAARGPIGAFIHLTPAPGNHLFNAADRGWVEAAFLLAKFLKPHLTAPEQPASRPAYLTVTRLDGALGTQTERGAILGGLNGLVKTLAQEWPRVFCRAVDVDPTASPAAIAAVVLAELHDPNRRVTETGHGPHGRVTLAAVPEGN